jgi:hypothetical protein
MSTKEQFEFNQFNSSKFLEFLKSYEIYKRNGTFFRNGGSIRF